MSKIFELKEKYNLAPDSYFPLDNNPKQTELNRQHNLMEEKNAERQWQFDKPEVKALKIKYRFKIEPKFEGFVGLNFVPVVWIDVLNEFLDYANDLDSNFRILTIKIKYGGLKISLSHSSEEIEKELRELEELLFDSKLI